LTGFVAFVSAIHDHWHTGERAQITKQFTVIAMTAHAMKGDQDRCLSAGMDGYVSKPIRTNELVSAIERLAGTLN
jgi:CheY-like chemotaxis protein